MSSRIYKCISWNFQTELNCTVDKCIQQLVKWMLFAHTQILPRQRLIVCPVWHSLFPDEGCGTQTPSLHLCSQRTDRGRITTSVTVEITRRFRSSHSSLFNIVIVSGQEKLTFFFYFTWLIVPTSEPNERI